MTFTLGADTLSLTLNTVALVLILDLDKLVLGVLSHGAYEQVANEFHMELDQSRISEAHSARYVHILGPTITIPFNVYASSQRAGRSEQDDYYFFLRVIVYQVFVGIAEGGLRTQGFK